MRHTKIIATVGPSTNSADLLTQLVAAGVDVFRLNFSHGTQDEHGDAIARIRQVAREAGRSVAILQDLGGPKIRTGKLRDHELILQPGDALTIASGDFIGDRGRVSTTYADLPRSLRAGDALLLDDGRIQLKVTGAGDTAVQTVVVEGGTLGEHKGINAPGVPLPSAGLTPKDASDLVFGVRAGVDFIALSFVQCVEDVRVAHRAAVAAGAPHLPIIAKLERPEALKELDDIVDAADAVMVARGDLGLEMPLERVPRVQKEITRKARMAGIPVILATQVLESMRTEPRPTRAEVSDAANAVDDGVDAIMLAGETAVGRYPVRAVQTLDAVICDAEAVPPLETLSIETMPMLAGHGRALCEAAVTLAHRGDAQAIVAVTREGKTARLLAALRPQVAIYAATEREDVARRLSLSWGVVPVQMDLSGDVETASARIGEKLVERGDVSSPCVIVVVGINLDLGRANANFLKLQRV